MTNGTDQKVSAEEIEEWEEEHDEPHPIFEVDHRPERQPVRIGPEPVAANEHDGDEDCLYKDCESEADYLVQLDDGNTFHCCQSCSRENRLWVKENGLLDCEVDA